MIVATTHFCLFLKTNSTIVASQFMTKLSVLVICRTITINLDLIAIIIAIIIHKSSYTIKMFPFVICVNSMFMPNAYVDKKIIRNTIIIKLFTFWLFYCIMIMRGDFMLITDLISITELSRLTKKSRPTIYKYINEYNNQTVWK